jgi:hypothetical protein
VEDECYQSVPGGYNLETLTLSLSGGNKKDEHLPPDNTLAILDTPYNNFTKGRVCLGNKQPVRIMVPGTRYVTTQRKEIPSEGKTTKIKIQI